VHLGFLCDGPSLTVVAWWCRGRAQSPLQLYGRDLTDEARRGLLDPVIGREQVMQRALQVGRCRPCLASLRSRLAISSCGRHACH
jgi:hypothetical protein